MPRDPSKKFRHFLAARHHRLDRPRVSEGRGLTYPLLFERLGPPFGLLALYCVLKFGLFLTPVYLWAHIIALVLWLAWVGLSLWHLRGFWARWTSARFAAPLVLLILFGSCWGWPGDQDAKAWVTPPDYARLPAAALRAPFEASAPRVLEGSVVHISLAAAPSNLTASLGEQSEELEAAEGDEAAASFTLPVTGKKAKLSLVLRRGLHRLGVWRLTSVPDAPPRIIMTEGPEVTSRKTIRFAYDAVDDFGIASISVRVAPVPSAQNPAETPVELPLLSPGVQATQGAVYADLTSLPWANVLVTAQLVATDGAGHKGLSAPRTFTLPSRAFRNPFARALTEERQKLAQAPDAAAREEAANVMAGIARQQGLNHGDPVSIMTLRAGAVRLVLGQDNAAVESVRDLLWKTAVRLEEGAIGIARADLSEAEASLADALARDVEIGALRPFLARLQMAMLRYFEALEAERARQPPALQELDWPLATADELLTPEDLQGRLAHIAALLMKGDRAGVRDRLDKLQVVIENLRTTPPELTANQHKIVQQVAALRALVRGQKILLEEVERLIEPKSKSAESQKIQRDGIARNLAQQQLMVSALREVMNKGEVQGDEVKASEKAMHEAVSALQAKTLPQAQKQQAEALALLQNALLSYSEQMRKSLTADKEP